MGQRMKSTGLLNHLRAIVASLLLTGASVSSGTGAELFAGRTITILSSGTPGGGYDAFARMLARHLGRHLPGSPAVVVRNVPGAGGLALANRLYNIEPKDGTGKHYRAGRDRPTRPEASTASRLCPGASQG